MDKRFLYKAIAPILGLILLVSGTIGVSAQMDNSSVSIAEARAAASYFLKQFSQKEANWVGASMSDSPVTYYSVDNQPIAYELTVLDKAGTPEGFIIMSATKDWMPVLEHSTGKAPSTYLADAFSVAKEANLAADNEFGSPTIYYLGGFAYFTQFGPKMVANKQMIHLTTPQIISKPSSQPTLSFSKSEARAEWDEAFRANVLVAALAPIFPRTERSVNTIVQITGVPSWYQSSNWNLFCDEGGAATTYPTCWGPPDDPWANWDGCAPIAASMVLGYWDSNGYSNFPTNDDEYLIDDLHYYMGTTYDGSNNTTDIGPGIESVSQIYSYDFTATLDTNVSWYDITGEIDAGRPFVLAGIWDAWGGHAVTARAYDTSSMEIGVHNTWDNSTHWVAYGAWTVMHAVKVTPGS